MIATKTPTTTAVVLMAKGYAGLPPRRLDAGSQLRQRDTTRW
jgi:hypothetical protein